VTDGDCVTFLQWALPQLQLRWAGFRRVRGQVCKRIARRLGELALPSIHAYRDYLQAHPDEWHVLGELCRVTISRFYRDRSVFDELAERVLPALANQVIAEGGRIVRCWSIGCASGEEAYTLAILFHLRLRPRFPALQLRVLATDVDEQVLARARRGVYAGASLKDLPPDLRARAFVQAADVYELRAEFRQDVEFRHQNVRSAQPVELFHLALCRNLVFTYFDDALQAHALERIAARVLPGGYLVLGVHESLPETACRSQWGGASPIYQKM